MPKINKRKSSVTVPPRNYNLTNTERRTKYLRPTFRENDDTQGRAGTINFNELLPRIDIIFNEIQTEYRRVPGLILTEDDLKCVLYNKLTSQPGLSCQTRTHDRFIRASAVHSEVTWFDESWRLRIKPDLTVIEPRYIKIFRRQLSRLERAAHLDEFTPRPSKEFGINGKALTFELKFARRGITDSFYRLVRMDYAKMHRLFNILDSRGEGDSVFSYLVILNKYRQKLDKGNPFIRFLSTHGSSHRHKIIYITGRFPLKTLSHFIGSGSFIPKGSSW